MDNEYDSKEMILRPEWALLTIKQLQKDAALCGIELTDSTIPSVYEAWITYILQELTTIEKKSPELLHSFLYRIDLPEKDFMQNPFPSKNLAESVFKRTFMKVWLKEKYKQ